MTLVMQLAWDTRPSAEVYAAQAVRNGNMEIDADHLLGMCGIASARLHMLLHANGVTDAQLWSNTKHCFVTLGSDVIDVTATQFGMSTPVTVMPIVDAVAYDWWEQKYYHRSARAFREHQIKLGWYKGQIVPKRILVDSTRLEGYAG